VNPHTLDSLSEAHHGDRRTEELYKGITLKTNRNVSNILPERHFYMMVGHTPQWFSISEVPELSKILLASLSPSLIACFCPSVQPVKSQSFDNVFTVSSLVTRLSLLDLLSSAVTMTRK
jgi:hypothetical protein